MYVLHGEYIPGEGSRAVCSGEEIAVQGTRVCLLDTQASYRR
jgi:hypothetical protein